MVSFLNLFVRFKSGLEVTGFSNLRRILVDFGFERTLFKLVLDILELLEILLVDKHVVQSVQLLVSVKILSVLVIATLVLTLVFLCDI